MTARGKNCWLIGALLVVTGCGGSVPESIRALSSALPARADGQYAFIEDEDVKKQLILKDSLFQCKIDLEDQKTDSAACRCSEAHSADWRADCKDWLGSHTPPPSAPSPASPSPTPPPPA
ncbi:MAG: hypothetical protein EOO73_10670 [Myxococcales bacterium]|nr:MAG: hypothetical protein EOO73_10670 [Myxococcales bacterium]